MQIWGFCNNSIIIDLTVKKVVPKSISNKIRYKKVYKQICPQSKSFRAVDENVP